jgi:hypothetical protein
MDNCRLTRGVWTIPYPSSIFRLLVERIRPIFLKEKTWIVSSVASSALQGRMVTVFGTAFLQMVHDLEEYARMNSDPAILNSVQEARSALEKLGEKMDNLEAGFDRIAERSCRSYVVRSLAVFSYERLQCSRHLDYLHPEGSVCSFLLLMALSVAHTI